MGRSDWNISSIEPKPIAAEIQTIDKWVINLGRWHGIHPM